MLLLLLSLLLLLLLLRAIVDPRKSLLHDVHRSNYTIIIFHIFNPLFSSAISRKAITTTLWPTCILPIYRAIYFKRANDESLFLILLEAWNHFFYTPCFFLFEMDYDSGTVTGVLDHVDASLEQSNSYSISHRNRVYCCIDI